MSLGGPKSQPLNDAVAAAVNAGLVMVVAASGSAGDTSPASEPLAYTIGSIDINDAKSPFSSYGPCMIPPSPFHKLGANGNEQSSISLPPEVTLLVTGLRLATTAQRSSAEPLWLLPMSRVSASTSMANTQAHTPPPARSPPQSPASPPRTRWLPPRPPQGRQGLLPTMGSDSKRLGGLTHHSGGLFFFFCFFFFVGACLGSWDRWAGCEECWLCSELNQKKKDSNFSLAET